MPPPDATIDATRPALSTALRSPWIDGKARDLLFYIATPLLLLPAILLLPGRPGVQDLLLYVGAFGALGHHLPGMMRAYGDRALFARFRWRFILAPLFLVPVCVFFSLRDLGGIILVTFFWTNWHTLMQIFGFARIYDAKAGSFGRWTSRFDQGLCVAWIGAPILWSDSRLSSVLRMWYGSGGPLLSADFIAGLRTAWAALTVAVTVAWLVHTLWATVSGHRPHPAKLALFVSSFTFWWICMAAVDNLLVGIALFDIFHDVQYLALVWTFNRARVSSDGTVGGFSRFLFRGRATLAGIYVGMVVAYGSIGYFGEKIGEESLRKALLGVLAASALLHFYFDGFIWKVRESSTRKALHMGGGRDIRLGGMVPGWAVHGAKWLLLIVPLAFMYHWDVTESRSERDWREAVALATPKSAEALTSLALTLDLRKEPDRVLELHRRAIAEKPSYAPAHHNYGAALYVLGRTLEAKEAFLEALRLNPTYAIAHRHLGSLLLASGEPHDAERHLTSALESDPRDGSAYAALAVLRANAHRTEEAVALYEKALSFKPQERTALNALAWIYATHQDAARRNGARAVACAETLLDLTGRGNPLVLDTVAAAYAEVGRFEDATATLQEALGLAHAQRRADTVKTLEQHLLQYQSRRPWRSGL